METHDAILVEGIRLGDRRSINFLVDRYTNPMTRMVNDMVGNPLDAEDIVIKTFSDAVTHINRYKPTHRFSTWLFTIAKNNSIDFLRGKRAGMLSMTDVSMFTGIHDHHRLPDKELMDKEDMIRLEKAMKRLKPREREIITLRCFDDLSFDEIASRRHQNCTTVRVIFIRTRNKLSKFFNQYN